MPSAVVTVTAPVVPVAGESTVSAVAVAVCTVAATPLNFTVLSAAAVLKLEPVMVTTVPAAPDKGLIAVTAGAGAIKVYVKVGPLMVLPPVLMLTGPVVPVAGAVTTSEVAVALVTAAAKPLNLHILLAAVVLKFVPVMVTVVPAAPDTGLMVVIDGTGVIISGGWLFWHAAAINKNITVADSRNCLFFFIAE